MQYEVEVTVTKQYTRKILAHGDTPDEAKRNASILEFEISDEPERITVVTAGETKEIMG